MTNFFEEVLPRGMSADIDFNDSLLEIVEILSALVATLLYIEDLEVFMHDISKQDCFSLQQTL